MSVRVFFLSEIAKVFLKLGSISFGGPAAHIAMMEKEVVNKKRWMTHEHFLDLVGVTNRMHSNGQEALTDWRSLTIALASLVLLLSFRKLNSAFVVLGGARAGYLLHIL